MAACKPVSHAMLVPAIPQGNKDLIGRNPRPRLELIDPLLGSAKTSIEEIRNEIRNLNPMPLKNRMTTTHVGGWAYYTRFHTLFSFIAARVLAPL